MLSPTSSMENTEFLNNEAIASTQGHEERIGQSQTAELEPIYQAQSLQSSSQYEEFDKGSESCFMDRDSLQEKTPPSRYENSNAQYRYHLP